MMVKSRSVQAPFVIKMPGLKLVAWLCLVFGTSLAIRCIQNHALKSGAIFVLIAGGALYLLLASGRYEVDDEHIVHVNYFGKYELIWSELVAIEESAGQFNLQTNDGRFVVLPPFLFLSSEETQAYQLILKRLRDLGLSIKHTSFGSLKTHKNTRKMS